MGDTCTDKVDSARAAAAQTWLAKRLEATDAAASDAVKGLTLTVGAVRAIETARTVVEAEESISNQRTNLISDDRRLRAAAALQAAAGTGKYPTHPLAVVCATLSLGEGSASDVQRIAALSAVASDLVLADMDCTRAMHERADAAGRARTAAEDLRAVRAMRATCVRGTRARAMDSVAAWDKVEIMVAKGAEYDNATGRYKMAVRQSGVSTDCTHEAVAAVSGRLRLLERELVESEEALKSYLDLPADLQLARERVEEAKQETRSADERIQKALHGIMD